MRIIIALSLFSWDFRSLRVFPLDVFFKDLTTKTKRLAREPLHSTEKARFHGPPKTKKDRFAVHFNATFQCCTENIWVRLGFKLQVFTACRGLGCDKV